MCSWQSSFNLENALQPYQCTTTSVDDTLHTDFAEAYRERIRQKLLDACNKMIDILDGSLLCHSTVGEANVFYLKMKGDAWRYVAEVSEGAAKTEAQECARLAHAETEKEV